MNNKCDGCKFYCNGRCFAEKDAPYVEYADCKGENNRPDIRFYLWHNLKDNPEDLPTVTSWYVVKVRSSDDLRIVYGHENVTPDKFDAWMRVECPF